MYTNSVCGYSIANDAERIGARVENQNDVVPANLPIGMLTEEQRRKITSEYINQSSDWTFCGLTPNELRMAVNHWNRYSQERELARRTHPIAAALSATT